ncbi:MAG: GNAT family N-acetyltransferase [Oceanipulchritudo sp.]
MIEHDPQEKCFRAPGGAILSYTIEGDRHLFDHTEVPPELRGQGVAAELATAALEHARENGWRVVPACSYIEVFIRRNREYADLVES